MRNTLIQIVLLCLIGYGVVSCAHQNEIVTLQDGRALEDQGNYIGAMEHYQKMPSPEFRDVCTHNLRYLYGDILDAMIAQKDNPNSAEAYYKLGKAYYEKALSIPEYPEIAPNAGLDTDTYFVEQQARFYTQAQTALESATQLQTNYQAALLLEGNLYEDIKEPEKAVTVYQQLVDLQPESPQVYYHLGILLYDRGHHEEGLELARQAVTKYPDNPDAHFALGILYAREGDDEQATAEFRQTLCTDRHRAEAYYRIAQLYLRQNNLIDAERVLRLGFMNNPESRKLGLFYGTLKSVLDTKEQEEAQSIYQQLAEETGVVQAPTKETALKSKEVSPALQLLHLRLRLNILQRQRPYGLPCANMEAQPYFDKQIPLIQEKIDKLTRLSQSEERSPSSAK